MRTFVWISGAALALSALPATAGQAVTAARPATGEAEKPSEKDMAALMQAMFEVEPLTAEQRDRLPQAARKSLRALTGTARWTWITGNHDREILDRCGGEQADEALVDGLVAPGHPSTPGYNDPQYPIEGRVPATGPAA